MRTPVSSIGLPVLLLLLVLPAVPLPAAPQSASIPQSWIHHISSIPCVDPETGLSFSPLGLAFDVEGDLYVVDADNSKILVAADLAPELAVFAGCPQGLQACQFVDIEADAGWFYVSERSGGLVVALDSKGAPVFETQVGADIGGIGLGAAGLVYGAMTLSGSIVVADVYGVKTPILCPISGGADGSYPVDCLVEKSGKVLVTDAFSKKVLILSLLGHPEGNLAGFEFKSPFGLAAFLDTLVLVSDSEFGCIAVYDSQGKFRGTFGQDHLRTPAFIDVRDDGTVCVADPGKMTIEVFHIESVQGE